MPYEEEFEGFVPITVLLTGQRIEGKAWKKAGRRLLQHIEQEQRDFVPIVDAYLTDESGAGRPAQRLAVIAVSTRAITAIIPGDTVTPFAAKAQESSGRDV